MEADEIVSVPKSASEDQTESHQGWITQRTALTKLLQRRDFGIEVVHQSPSRPEPQCSSLKCKTGSIASGYRIQTTQTFFTDSAGETTGPHGIFHIRCLEELLELSSPDVLPHIIFGNASVLMNQLDLGAIEILKAWYGQCAMDNKITVSIIPEPAGENISDSEPSTHGLPDTPSSQQTAETPKGAALEWNGPTLVPRSSLRRKGDLGNDDQSWHHNTDELFVPWAEDIVTNKLPRLPEDGGLISEDDAFLRFGKFPVQDKQFKAWHILTYLPEPPLWRERHTLSESLNRWHADRLHVNGGEMDFEQRQDEAEERKDRLGFKVTKEIRALSKRAPAFPRTELQAS